MSPHKARLVHACLIAFAVWPAVQIGLVARFEVNPWKLMGWGMYAVPQMPAELEFSCDTAVRPGGCPWSVLPAHYASDERAFLRRRLGLGRLARPDALARAVLDREPEIERLTIEVVQPVMNRRTGLIEERRASYDYRR